VKEQGTHQGREDGLAVLCWVCVGEDDAYPQALCMHVCLYCCRLVATTPGAHLVLKLNASGLLGARVTPE
jgi:hypothetical protein